MAQRRKAPNGITIVFPDDISEQEIQEYLSQEKYQTGASNKDWSWESDRNFLTDMPIQAAGGALDAINSGVGFIEGLGDTLGEKTKIGGLVFGEQADNGYVGYKSHDELVKSGASNPLFGKFGVKDAARLPTLDAPDTMIGGFTRGISQFITGWVSGGRVVKGAATFLPSKTAIKATQAIQAAPISTALARGSLADVIAFDEHQGRLTDVILNYAPEMKDTWLGYLAADPNDSFWEGRMKNAIEGLFLGGITETVFRGYRFFKNRKAKNEGKKVDEKILRQDEEFLAKQNLEEGASLRQTELPEGTPTIRIKGDPTKVQSLEFDKVIDANFERFRKSSVL